MPIYEYAPLSGECRRCHGRFEVYQRMADDKLTRCPDCDHEWQEQWSCACDSQCPNCGLKNITALSWSDVAE